MKKVQIGIIGGTGLGEVLLKEAGGETVDVATPYGPPAGPPIVANWEGIDVAFLSRHGPGHCFNPTMVPYRANIFTMKKLGVQAVIASGATGSLREEIRPTDLVVCDQVIDKTLHRTNTFFDEGVVAHVEFADPFCPWLGGVLRDVGKNADTTVHPKGTYVCMEGPQFSTRAESQLHRQWGADLIGMTCMPEAKLAREAELCYALLALPTDYDCWRPADPAVGAAELLREILGNLQRVSQNALSLIREALKAIETPLPPCRCREALKSAIWTDKSRIEPAIRERLEPLISRHLAD